MIVTKMRNLPCVYEIRNDVNGRRYIGSTVDFPKRKSRHLANLRKNTHTNPLLQYDFNKYGEKAFVFHVLERTCDDILLDMEQYYICLHYGNIYNCRNATQKQVDYQMISKMIEGDWEEEPEPLIDDYDWELMKESDPNLSEQ